VPGLFWRLYETTGDASWATRATNWTNSPQANVFDPDNDQGFQIYYSFGLGYELTGKSNSAFRSSLVATANNFDTQRFSSTIGCYRSWTNRSSNPVDSPSITDSTPNPDDPIFEVNIDQMMNLELPLYVGALENNATLTAHAVAHADRTWTENIRADGGCVHVIGYNTDGSVQYQRTHQGWPPDSTWSRGQAWAVYGYAMVYRYTSLPRMLTRAEKCFDYFMGALSSQSTDGIPYSDFDAPVNSQNPKDTSAAAIVASAAIDLYRLTGQIKYRDTAETLLLSLSNSTNLSENTNYEPILRRGSSKWGDPKVGTIFGDDYFAEALPRYKSVIGFVVSADPTDPIPSASWRLVNISTRANVGDGNNLMVAGFVVADAPRTFLLRGVGPTLASFQIPQTATDPILRLLNQTDPNTPIAENDDWSTNDNSAEIAASATTVGAFTLNPGTTEAALLTTLAPGVYPLQLSKKKPVPPTAWA